MTFWIGIDTRQTISVSLDQSLQLKLTQLSLELFENLPDIPFIVFSSVSSTNCFRNRFHDEFWAFQPDRQANRPFGHSK